MDFKSLGKAIIQKGAPLLGAALGGPAGATVGALIANAFDANPSDPADIINKINLDPQSQIKLIEIQKSHEIEIAKLALQSEVENNKDRASARSREVEIAKTGQRDWMPSILSMLVTFGFFSTIFAIMSTTADPNDKEVLYIMLGGLSAAFTSIISYYFGSSASSKAKDQALFNNGTKA